MIDLDAHDDVDGVQMTEGSTVAIVVNLFALVPGDLFALVIGYRCVGSRK